MLTDACHNMTSHLITNGYYVYVHATVHK